MILQRPFIPLSDLLEEIIKADLRFGALNCFFLCRVLTLFDKLSCHALVFDRR